MDVDTIILYTLMEDTLLRMCNGSLLKYTIPRSWYRRNGSLVIEKGPGVRELLKEDCTLWKAGL